MVASVRGASIVMARGLLRQCVRGYAWMPPRHALELGDVVAAEDLDIAPVPIGERAYLRLVRQSRTAVLLEHPLVKPKAGRASRMGWVHFALVEIRVGREEHPAVFAAHGYAAVPM